MHCRIGSWTLVALKQIPATNYLRYSFEGYTPTLSAQSIRRERICHDVISRLLLITHSLVPLKVDKFLKLCVECCTTSLSKLCLRQILLLCSFREVLKSISSMLNSCHITNIQGGGGVETNVQAMLSVI